MTKLANRIDELQRRRAATIFETARDDYLQGRLSKARGVPATLSLLSLIILATPLILVSFAVVLLSQAGINAISVVLSTIFLIAGAFLLWKRPRRFKTVWTANDAPATFALIHEIAARTGAPPISRLVVSDEMNAYATRDRGQNYLGFGAQLWALLTQEERTAVIAHECAHFVNGDCLRSGLTGRAFGVLQRWYHMIEPADDSGLEALVFQVPVSFALELLISWMLRLAFIESQRAEYLADAIAAEAVGVDAMARSLETLALVPIWQRRHLEMHGSNSPKGHEMLDALCRAVRDPAHPLRAGLLKELESEDHKLDTSHPPTRFRLQFLEHVGTCRADRVAITADWCAIAKEWDHSLRAAGDELHAAASPQ